MAINGNSVWISHTAISEFLKCPRLYYLRKFYRNPVTGHRVSLVNPYLSLGDIVHKTLNTQALLPTGESFITPLVVIFEDLWQKVSGEKGGFISDEEENQFKQKGLEMIKKIQDNPGPLLNKAFNIPPNDIKFPILHMPFNSDGSIVLCGNIDWIEYIPEADGMHIIDFKTGMHEEEGSLQLPIYCLLAKHFRKKPIVKTSYWYLQKDSLPTEQEIPDLKKSHDEIMEYAEKIRQFRNSGDSSCPKNGCYGCREMDKIVKGEAKFVKFDGTYDCFIIPETPVITADDIQFTKPQLSQLRG